MRRAPNIVAFLLTGVVLGIAIGSLVAVRSTTGNYSHGGAVGLLAIVGGVLGGIVAGVVVVLLDRRSAR